MSFCWNVEDVYGVGLTMGIVGLSFGLTPKMWQASFCANHDGSLMGDCIHVEQSVNVSNAGLRYRHEDVVPWKCLPHYWPFVRGIHRSPVDSPHKGSVMPMFGVFFDISLNRMSNKHSICRWLKTPLRSCEITVMHNPNLVITGPAAVQTPNGTQSSTHLPLDWTKWPPFHRRYFQMHFREWTFFIFWLKFTEVFPKDPIDNNQALVKIMAWRRIGDKPLPEPILTWITDAYMLHQGGDTLINKQGALKM